MNDIHIVLIILLRFIFGCSDLLDIVGVVEIQKVLFCLYRLDNLFKLCVTFLHFGKLVIITHNPQIVIHALVPCEQKPNVQKLIYYLYPTKG